MSATNRILSGPNVSTPADLSGDAVAAEMWTGPTKPSTDADAAYFKTSRLEWSTDCVSLTSFLPSFGLQSDKRHRFIRLMHANAHGQLYFRLAGTTSGTKRNSFFQKWNDPS